MKNKIAKISIFFFISALVMVVLIYFLMAGIKSDSESIVSAKSRIAILEAQLDETNKFVGEYGNYTSGLTQLAGMFVDLENPVEFIKFLESNASELAMTSQVQLPSLQQSNQNALFNFSGTGSMANVLMLIKKIELGQYLVDIQSLSIEPAKSNSEIPSGMFDLDFTLKVFTK